MSRLTETILDAIYPPNLACAICGSEAHADSHCLCEECAALIQPAGIIGGSGFIDDIYCAVHYTEHIAAAVHNYKYNDARYLCRFFASLMELPSDWQIDAVLPGGKVSVILGGSGCGKSSAICSCTLIKSVRRL